MSLDYVKWSSGNLNDGIYNDMVFQPERHETFGGGSLGDENTSDDVPAWESEPMNWDYDSAKLVAEKLLMIDSNAGGTNNNDGEMNFQLLSNLDAVEEDQELTNPRFKTEFCRNFREKGTCLYGDLCQFAHGKVELRQDVVRHSKYKTKLCQKFWIAGYCAYGPRCNFIHQQEEQEESKSAEAPVTGFRPFTKPYGSRKNSESSVDSGFENGMYNQTRMQIPTKMQVGVGRRSSPPPPYVYTTTVANRPRSNISPVGTAPTQLQGHSQQQQSSTSLNANAKEFQMGSNQSFSAPPRRPSYGSEMIRNFYADRTPSSEERRPSNDIPHPEDNPISSALSAQLGNLNLDINRSDNSPWREIRF